MKCDQVARVRAVREKRDPARANAAMLALSQAAANAERLYEAIVEQRKAKLADPSVALISTSDLVFDPTRPQETDWERILSAATSDMIRKQKRRQKDN